MSQDIQELERLRAAFASVDDATDPECPAGEMIWNATRGELPPREMRVVLDHVASCSACSEDWRLAVEVDRQVATPRTMENAPSGRLVQGRFGQWRTWTAAAALAAGLLIAVGLYRTGSFGPQEPTYREAPGSAIHSLLAEGEALPRQGAVLRWSPLAGATSYDVRISTEDLTLLDTRQGLTGTGYRLPESTLATLPAGSKLLWQVEAIFPDGSRQSSPTFTNPLR